MTAADRDAAFREAQTQRAWSAETRSNRDPIADALTEVPVRTQTRRGVTTLTPSSALKLAQHLRDRKLIIETQGDRA